MKYTLAVVALAAAVSAQSLSDIPACALPCIDQARTAHSSCAADDYKCLCDHMDVLKTPETVNCVLGACGADTAINKVLPAITAFCQAIENGGGSPSPSTSGAASTSSEPASTSQPASTSENASSSGSAPSSEPTPSSESATSLEPTGYPTATSYSSSAAAGSSSVAAGSSTAAFSSYPGTSLVPTHVGGGSSANAPASTATSATSAISMVPTAGGALPGSIGGFAMMVLGILAAW